MAGNKITTVWSDLDSRIVQDAQGGIKKAENVAAVLSAINNILKTSPGERCLTGDTLISLINGKEITLKELSKSKEEFWVYSINLNNSRIEPAKARAFCTGKKKTIQITLDNGQKIDCTPDHKFMLRNGHYREAKYLKSGDSLMPIYLRENTEGYLELYQPILDIWESVHKMVMNWKILFCGIRKYFCIHHKNFNKKDNCPENLLLVDKKSHFIYHSKHSKEWNQRLWHSEEFAWYRKLMESGEMQRRVAQNPEFSKAVSKGLLEKYKDPREKEIVSKRCSEMIKKLNQRPDIKVAQKLWGSELGLKFWNDPQMEDARKRNIKARDAGRIQYINSERGQKDFQKKGKKVGKTSVLHKLKKHIPIVTEKFGEFSQKTWELYLSEMPGKTSWAYPSWDNIQKTEISKGLKNHKVLSVLQDLEEKEVYDLVVEKNHNFALAAGVFVHNCMRPTFGCGLRDLLFENMDDSVIKLVAREIQEKVEIWDNRVQVVDITIDSNPDNSSVSVQINFAIKGQPQIFQYVTEIKGEI